MKYILLLTLKSFIGVFAFKPNSFKSAVFLSNRISRNGFHHSSLSMKLQTGIVGLPNVGKSTLFNALVGSELAQAANFPFCTIEPNVGLVNVPDSRLEKLAEINKSVKIMPAVMEFVG